MKEQGGGFGLVGGSEGRRVALTRRVGDAVLVLADDSREPVLLDGAACTVWDRLGTTPSVPDLVEELATEFEADVEAMSTAVAEVLGLLDAHGLLQGPQ